MSVELKGSVTKLIYHNDGDGYSIFRLLIEKTENEISCVGVIDPIKIGDLLSLSGEYVEHDRYGRQFKADYIRRAIPTEVKAFADYLERAIDGVGKATAHKIVQEFGKDTFDIIENNPEKLSEINGISLNKAEKIHSQFIENNSSRDEQLFYIQLGLTSYVYQLKNKYKDKVKDVVYTNPYRLIDDINGIGFMKADAIAQKTGIPMTSVFRIYHGIIYVLESNSNMEGNLYLEKSELIKEASIKLEVSQDIVQKTLNNLIKDKKLIDDNSLIYLPKYFHMENYIANNLTEKLFCNYQEIDEMSLTRKVKKIERSKNRNLDSIQRKAVIEGVRNNVMIITGGPGTGKTTTIDTLLTLLEKKGKKIKLAAPTGRAAKRMTEQTGRDAQTIHRLINLQKCDDESENDFDKKIEADVVIVDEASMIDVTLMYLLLKAMDVSTKLILVGDVDQLPSVGPGTILKDLIDSKIIPVVKLIKIYRQDKKSTIVPNAHKIRQGICPKLSEESNDFFFVKRTNAKAGLEALLIMMLRNIPHKLNIKPTDVQILCPVKKGILGVDNLNKVIQGIINPPNKYRYEVKNNNVTFREGDKVMHIKNDYNLEWKCGDSYGVGVFNGDVGFIQSIKKNVVTVVYEDQKIVEYENEKVNELTLAYAVTIHKSQGSEYPAIIIPVLNGGPPMLYNRMLLYTAVTRAVKCEVIIGNPKNIFMMVKNADAIQRNTQLSQKLYKKRESDSLNWKIFQKNNHIKLYMKRKRGTNVCKIKKVQYKWKAMKSN